MIKESLKKKFPGKVGTDNSRIWQLKDKSVETHKEIHENFILDEVELMNSKYS